jgi:hypothetical protein
VGIGAARRKGDPAVENVYTMTVARIVDLTKVDFSDPIGPDFTGPRRDEQSRLWRPSTAVAPYADPRHRDRSCQTPTIRTEA